MSAAVELRNIWSQAVPSLQACQRIRVQARASGPCFTLLPVVFSQHPPCTKVHYEPLHPIPLTRQQEAVVGRPAFNGWHRRVFHHGPPPSQG